MISSWSSHGSASDDDNQQQQRQQPLSPPPGERAPLRSKNLFPAALGSLINSEPQQWSVGDAVLVRDDGDEHWESGVVKAVDMLGPVVMVEGLGASAFHWDQVKKADADAVSAVDDSSAQEEEPDDDDEPDGLMDDPFAFAEPTPEAATGAEAVLEAFQKKPTAGTKPKESKAAARTQTQEKTKSKAKAKGEQKPKPAAAAVSTRTRNCPTPLTVKLTGGGAKKSEAGERVLIQLENAERALGYGSLAADASSTAQTTIGRLSTKSTDMKSTAAAPVSSSSSSDAEVEADSGAELLSDADYDGPGGPTGGGGGSGGGRLLDLEGELFLAQGTRRTATMLVVELKYEKGGRSKGAAYSAVEVQQVYNEAVIARRLHETLTCQTTGDINEDDFFIKDEDVNRRARRRNENTDGDTDDSDAETSARSAQKAKAKSKAKGKGKRKGQSRGAARGRKKKPRAGGK